MIFRFEALLLTSVLILTLAPAAHAADVAAGKANYALCVVCHGANGEGNAAMNAPLLAGLQAWYMKRQLEAFRKGWRGTADGDTCGMQMRPMALIVGGSTPEDDLIGYIASLPAQAAKPTIAGDIAAGKSQYAACASCHGQNAEGNPQLAAPRLAGRDDWYLARQLRNYRSGRRGYAPDDTPGMQMRAMAATLKDDQAIIDVVAYIASIR